MKKVLSSLKSVFFLIFRKYPNLSLNVDYDEYWGEKRNGTFGIISDFQQERLRLVSKNLLPGKTIKDIGCGEGSFLFNLINVVPFETVYGIDISKKALNNISKSGVHAIDAQIMDSEVRKSLPVTDYSTLLELLEHTDNPEQILMDIIENTKEKVVFSVPNTGYIGHRLRLLFGSFPLQWRRNPSEHLRFWTVSDMKWWLSELGLLESSEILIYEGIPLLNLIIPNLFGQGIIVTINVNNSKN